MAAKSSDSDPVPFIAPLVPPNVPPAPLDEPTLQPGPGQVVVTSPTGLKSVVDEAAVASLKPQGYRVD